MQCNIQLAVYDKCTLTPFSPAETWQTTRLPDPQPALFTQHRVRLQTFSSPTYRQWTTVRPSLPSYCSCHFSSLLTTFSRERLEGGVSLYAGQPMYCRCCTMRYPSCGWNTEPAQGAERGRGRGTGRAGSTGDTASCPLHLHQQC